MARYFLNLSYNGTGYNGWQQQKNTKNTIQQVLEEKISLILKERIELTGCGRTDTGVNAKNFIAHFDSHCKDLIENKYDWIYKFNNLLPSNISIQDIYKVKNDAHARFSATQRVYYYYLQQEKNPFKDNFSWYVYGNLDFELMNKAAKILLEYNDFTSFSKLHTQNKTNACNIKKAIWQNYGKNEWRFSISADRFLRGMVRAIVGTLILVGKNKLSLAEFRKIIETKDRKVAGNNAPANALFLVSISYSKNIFDE